MDLARLRDFDSSAVVVRDHSFANLGWDLRFPRADMLTYCGSAQFLRQAAASDDVSCILTTEKAYAIHRKRHGDIETKGLAFVGAPRDLFFRFHNYLFERTDFYRRRADARITTSTPAPQTTRIASSMR